MTKREIALSDLDIYRSAKVLIEQHGKNADLEAVPDARREKYRTKDN